MNCHNGEQYLVDSLKSVINQTYKNWEIIFWENYSSDKSAEIFKNFSESQKIDTKNFLKPKMYVAYLLK